MKKNTRSFLFAKGKSVYSATSVFYAPAFLKAFIFSFLLLPVFSSAQNKHRIDSLERMLKTAKGRARVDALNALSAEERNSDTVYAAKLNAEALRLAGELNYKTGKADALLSQGKLFVKRNDRESATKSYYESLHLSQEINYDHGIQNAYQAIIMQARKTGDPNCENLLKEVLAYADRRNDDTCRARFIQEYGMYYYYQGDMKRSLESFRKGIALYEKVHSEVDAAGLTMNMGVLQYKLGDYDASLETYEKAYAKFLKLNDSIDLAKVLENLGITYRDQGKLDSGYKKYEEALLIYKKLNNQEYVAGCLENMALVLQSKGRYSETLDKLLQCLKVREDMNDQRGIAISYNNIGEVYSLMNQEDKNLEYLDKALQINIKMADKYNIAVNYSAMASAYLKKDNYAKAKECVQKALALRQDIDDKPGISTCYLTLGNIAEKQKETDKALDYYQRSLALKKEIGAENEAAGLLSSIGTIYFDKHDYARAIGYYQQAQSIWNKNGERENLEDSYLSLAKAYAAIPDYANAYNTYIKYSALKDSMLNSDITRQLTDMSTRYETEKTARELKLKSLELDKKNAEVKQQYILIYTALGAGLLFLVIAFFALRSYRIKRRAHMELEMKNRIIEEKNTQIEDSIQYAVQIQRSMLPNPADIERVFPQCFGLFKPKDVVSGDFYWFTEKRGKKYIAAVDCTGHGVPGGFMSMLGNDKLHDAVEKGFTRPGEMLMALNMGVKKALKQNRGNATSRDGMDIALLAFNEEKTKAEFAGANRPLWLIRNNECIVYAPTKSAIGGFTHDDQVYDTTEIDLVKGDTLYIFSDGYPDQFGGEKGKKFTTRRFRELLLSIQDKNMAGQEAILEKNLLGWQRGLEQIDDILVIGIRI